MKSFRLYAMLCLAFLLVACTDPPATATPVAQEAPAIVGEELGAEPVADTEPTGLRTATPESVLKVARLVAEHEGPQGVLDYCDKFAVVLSNPQQFQQCQALAGKPAAGASTRRLTVPKTKAELFTVIETLPLRDRFAMCSSDQAARLLTTKDDYARCMPVALQEKMESESGVSAWDTVGKVEPYEMIFFNASRMSATERAAYCNVDGVMEQLDEEGHANCLKGIDPNATTDAGPSEVSEPAEAFNLDISATNNMDGDDWDPTIQEKIWIKSAEVGNARRKAHCNHYRSYLNQAEYAKCLNPVEYL